MKGAITTETVDLPTYYASWLFNADSSVYTNDELREVMQIERDYGSFVSLSDEMWFGQYKNMGCNLSTYTYIPICLQNQT